MYLSCLNHLNELPKVLTANRPILNFMRFYIL